MKSIFPTIKKLNRRIIKENISALSESFQNKLINNLSNHNLSRSEKNVLGLGLNFVPTPPSHQVKTEHSLEQFKNTLKCQYHFRNTDTPPTKKPVPNKSNWKPPEPHNAQLNNFLEKISEPHLPNTHAPKSNRNNLLPDQTTALKNLEKNNNIVIKPCDKGGGICIMNTADYINKIRDLLSDTTTYKRLTHDPTPAITQDIISLLEYLYTRGSIDEQTKNALLPPCPHRTPLFYGLPKVHKPDIPLRYKAYN